MTIDSLAQLVGTTGVSVLIVLALIFGIYKGAPKVLEAYKEGNKSIVDAIKELSLSLETRITTLENKVDVIEDKIDDLQKEEV